MSQFRFEDLEVWRESIKLADELFDLADKANDKKLYRLAEQLRGASLSISNNIAEGSGSFSDKDFANFLNIARRSAYECANMMFIFQMRKLIGNEEKEAMLKKLRIISSKITNFRKTLLRKI